MTSLKGQYADEIARNMAKNLSKNEFSNTFQKAASFLKEAGAALESYKQALTTVADKATLDAAWNEHVNAVSQEEESLTEMACLQAKKARSLGISGYSVPGCDADDQSVEIDQSVEDDDQCACVKEEEEMPAWDIAADFALSNLVKIANALDSEGFKTLADEIDKVMMKIAKKKKKKEEEKEEDKEDKKKKKDKEDKEDKEDKKKKKDKKDKEDE